MSAESRPPPTIPPLMLPWTPHRQATYQLMRAENIGTRTITKIVERYPDLSLFLRKPMQWKDIGLTDAQTHGLIASLNTPIEEDLTRMEKEGVQFLLPSDDAFPARLRQIPSPPAALFVRGAPLEDTLAVAIVGTRKKTPYGERCATFFASELAHIGATIVSGLALGLDGVAHRATIEASGTTIAVVPGGIDDRSIVPQSHLPLAKRILDTRGTLCSERAPGATTFPFDYLHRNRLIAGLADAVIVVEGDHDSGALVTARHALEQGKEVLAIPGSIWSTASRGTNALIRDGAVLCATMDDALNALKLRDPHRAREAARTREILPASPEEAEVLALLDTPTLLDDLVRKSKKSPGVISGIVSVLEMKGRVIAVGPRTYARI